MTTTNNNILSDIGVLDLSQGVAGPFSALNSARDIAGAEEIADRASVRPIEILFTFGSKLESFEHETKPARIDSIMAKTVNFIC